MDTAKMSNELADKMYVMALQRAIEQHCRGEFVDSGVAALCPHHAKKLDEAIAALRSEPVAWKPIETAPRDGTEIDVWCPEDDGGYRVADAWWSKEDGKWRTAGDDRITWMHQPTHWMPLPAAPSREQDQRGGKSGETPDLEGLKVQSTPHLTASPARLSAEQVENARHELHEGITVSSWVIDRLCDAALSSLTARSDGIEAAANVCRKELDDCPSTPRLFDRGYACACENLMERISALKEGK